MSFVKLKKDPNSGNYFAHFKDAKGKLVKMSTGVADLGSAKAVVDDAGLEQLSQAAAAGALSRDAVSRIIHGKNLTMQKCVAPYNEWLTNRCRSPRTIDAKNTTLRAWFEFCDIADVSPQDVSAADISRFINNPKSSNKRSSRQQMLHVIRNFYEFLFYKGWILENAAMQVEVDFKNLTHEQRESANKEPFTTEEVNRLVAYLRGQLADVEREIELAGKSKDYSETGRRVKLAKLGEQRQSLTFWHFAVQLSLATGLRLSDICQLEWSCFDKAGVVALWMDKTEKRIEHALPDKLAELVTTIPVNHSQYLFPEQRAIILDLKKRGGLSVQFKRLCDYAKIAGKTFHCLRHGTATEFYKNADKDTLAKKLAEILTVKEIQGLLGHSNSSTTKRYIH